MTNLIDLTTSQLNSIIAIKQQIEELQGQIEAIASGGAGTPASFVMQTAPRRRMSALGRARIAAGAQKRWSKLRLAAAKVTLGMKKGKRRLSAAGRAAIIAGSKARWAKVRGSQPRLTAANKTDRRTSPAVKAKLAAIARARWARVRAEGKKTL